MFPLPLPLPSSSLDQTLQRGCLEALHKLSLQYPPLSLPEEWGCAHYPCTILATVQPLLESSRLTWGIQGEQHQATTPDSWAHLLLLLSSIPPSALPPPQPTTSCWS